MTAILEFKTTYKGKKATHWVHLAPSAAEAKVSSTWHRVEKLRPPEVDGLSDESLINSDTYQAMKARWERIGPAFEAYLEGSEIPESGTPIAAWGALTAEQMEIFRGLKVRTVEEIAELKDSNLQRIPLPNARQLRQLAKDFLQNKPAAEAQAELASLREQMAALQAQMSAPKRKPKSEAA